MLRVETLTFWISEAAGEANLECSIGSVSGDICEKLSSKCSCPLALKEELGVLG